MQPSLFEDTDPTPTPQAIKPETMARAADPDTSHSAARGVTESGTAATQRERVLTVVNTRPGLTSDEIAEELGVSRYLPARRLPELERQDLVLRGKARPSRVTGRPGITWWPAGTPAERLAA